MKMFGKDFSARRICLTLVGVFFATAILGGFYLFAKREYILRDALNHAEQIASEMIGTKVKIGNAFLEEWKISSLEDSALILEDVEVFDNKDELMAKVDKAKVTFKLLNLYDYGAGAIEEIKITGAQTFIKKRDDESWNFQDIKVKDTGESTFDALINLSGGTVSAEFDGKNISVEEIEASADCANMDAIKTKLIAKTLESNVVANGTVSADKQIINAIIDTADIPKILSYLPEDLLPENVKIYGGVAQNFVLNLYRRGDVLSYSGSSNVSDGAVKVEKTEIKNIAGNVNFTDSQYIINASAEAEGQPATVRGTIRTDTDEMYFDLTAESDGFAPSAVIENLGIDGAAAFTAHIFGTANNPKVDAEISSNYIGYENISAQNVKTNFRYVNNSVYLSNIYAETFGGAVTGEFELDAQKMAYNSHLKVNGVNIAQIVNYVGSNAPVYGSLNADVALNGTGADLKTLKVYGQADGNNVYYQDFLVNNFESSFYLKEDDVKFDYLKLNLPNEGKVNLEGTLTDAKKLDMEFYGAHVDLSLAKTFDSAIDVSGMSDFIGSIHGDIDNPQISLKMSAVDTEKYNGVKGELFKQKFDSMNVAMSGSLDAVNIENFQLEKGGKIQWQVIDGWINLKERKLNVRLDTVGARLEGLVALLAPDQQLTGEIDNTIRVQGSFDDPELVGYVEMHYGSYQGILITGMRGDYYIEDGDKFRLQDFEIITPMIDMVLNGTLNIKNYALDMVVRGREIDLKRFEHQFPYAVSGVGKFEGTISGSVNAPKFDGQLTSDSFIFNGIELKNITGHIGATGNSVVLDDAKFEQGNGNYEMYLGADLESEAINGAITVQNVDIQSLAALANYQAKLLNGELTSSIEIGGTMKNPTVRVIGSIPKGNIGNYDLHGVQLDMNLINHVANLNLFKGYQGAEGEFEVVGTADLNGELNLTGSAKKFELGFFGAAAGSDVELVGDANVDLKITGNINNPEGVLLLTASGGIDGSTFDLMSGHILFKDWVFDVKELSVERAIGDQVYHAGVKGTIPFEALYLENNDPNAQMNLQVSFDDADLSLLPTLSDMVAWATGEMGGSLTITGTASNPQINGKISLDEGTVKIKGMKNQIEHFNIATEFVGNKFIVSDFSGNIGEGKFTLNGGFNFANFTVSNYAFDFVADNLDIRTSFFTGPLNAQFSLTEVPLRDRVLPKIAGHVDLEKCLFSIPSIPDSEDELPEILLDVAINLGKKVHFYSPRLYNMYLTGGVRYEGSTRHPKPSGIISTKRGATVTYIQTVFDVREGELHFNQLGSFLPTVNFMADARVSNIKVELEVTGVLNNTPKIKLTSTPEKTETEIIQLLTLRDAYGKATSSMSMGDILAIGLQMSVLGNIEDTIKRTLGLDRFVISGGSGSAFERFSGSDKDRKQDDNQFNISIGKYVTDKLMLRYTQGINGDKITRYGIQYDINDNIGITIEREKGDFIFSLEAMYKF